MITSALVGFACWQTDLALAEHQRMVVGYLGLKHAEIPAGRHLTMMDAVNSYECAL